MARRFSNLLAGSLAAMLVASCGTGPSEVAAVPDASNETEAAATAIDPADDPSIDDSVADSIDIADGTLDGPEDIDPADELAADEADDLASQAPTDVDPGELSQPDDDNDDDAVEDENDGPGELGDLSGLPDTAGADTNELGDGADATIDQTSANIPTKIKYVLVIVKENHTFDNYFTGFPGASSSYHAWRYDKQNHRRIRFLRPIAPPDTLPTGPGHTHGKALAAYRNGHMDGFSVNPGMTPYIRYTRKQIPDYWKYASNFVLADHYFSTTLGPSSPGHEVFWFARSTTIDNPKCHLPGGKGCGSGCLGNHLSATTFNPTTGKTRTVAPCFDLPSLPDHLPQGFTWFDYGGAHAMMIKSQRHVSVKKHYGKTGQLLKDLRNGVVHNLMIAHVTGDVSEHPRQGPCKGERFTVDVINAAMQLPEWKHMAIIVTWDDWGGFYDHVEPPVHTSTNGARFGRGFRLPLIIISPYAKKGFVLKTRAEQASVPRLVEELWGMKLMSKRNAHARDGVAGSLMGAFDFSQPPRDPLILQRRTCPGDPAATQ